VADPSETPDERRTRYLRLAEEVEELSTRCKDIEVRDAYLALALSWRTLAAAIARNGSRERS